jgi:hypothetical protein
MASMFPTSAMQRRIQRNCRGQLLVAVDAIHKTFRWARIAIAYLESAKANTENVHICGVWEFR